MTRAELAKKITKYLYDYLQDVDCSCSYNYFGDCWYHMNDEDRIEMLSKTVERILKEDDGISS